MAVVPDKMLLIREKIGLMNNNLNIVINTINQYELNIKSNETILFQHLEQNTANKYLIKHEPTLNDTFLTSPSSSSSSNDSISSLVTESSKIPNVDSLDVNTRQLRSTNSKSSLTNNNLINSTNENAKSIGDLPKRLFETFQINFSLTSNDLMCDLVKNLNSNNSFVINGKTNDVNNSNSSNNMLKFKCELRKILEKMDLSDLNKLFKIECIKCTQLHNKCQINKNEDESLYNLKINNGSDENDHSVDDINELNPDCNTDSLVNNGIELKNKNVPSTIILDDNLNCFKRIVSLNELKLIEMKLKNEIDSDESKFNEEIDKKNKYKVKNCYYAD